MLATAPGKVNCAEISRQGYHIWTVNRRHFRFRGNPVTEIVNYVAKIRQILCSGLLI